MSANNKDINIKHYDHVDDHDDDDDDDNYDDDEIGNIGPNCRICDEKWGAQTLRLFFACMHIVCKGCFANMRELSSSLICPFCRAKER